MITVIFEVIPHENRKQEYLDIAASLKPLLETIAGFISIERFQSLANPGKILSLSCWESEESIHQWRNLEMHRFAQQKGRKRFSATITCGLHPFTGIMACLTERRPRPTAGTF